MGEQIKHEAEVSRQHARYRIPAKISVNNNTFSLREWSVSGFSTDHISTEIGEEKAQSGKLIFDSGDFTLSVPIEFEVRKYNADSGFMRARFVNMNRRNLALLHHIINSYLAGEILAAGDILEVAGRENYVKKDLDAQEEGEVSTLRKTLQTVKRVVGYALLLAALAGLVWFIGYTAYNRMFLVEALSARVHGDVVVLRAPDNGVFEIPENRDENPGQGQLLGVVKLIGGGVASILNPCDCRLQDVHSLDGAFVGRGEPLFTLMPEDETLSVTAFVAFNDVAQLETGQSARIRLTDGSLMTGRIERIRAASRLENRQSGAEIDAEQVAEVSIVTDEPIPAGMLDTVASVSFDTLWDVERN